MRWIISRYNHDISYLKDYTDDYIMYDRSEEPVEGSIVVPNIGSDIYDKFTYIIDNYDNLPDIAVYTKANIFKYITKEEFDLIKDNKTFTPILTQHHKVYEPVCRYSDGIYEEKNDYWYLNSHPCQSTNSFNQLVDLLGMKGRDYNKFAPGSNYILTKKDIHRRSKEFYVKIRSYLDWTVYPGEAQIIERNLYYIWNTPKSQ